MTTITLVQAALGCEPVQPLSGWATFADLVYHLDLSSRALDRDQNPVKQLNHHGPANYKH